MLEVEHRQPTPPPALEGVAQRPEPRVADRVAVELERAAGAVDRSSSLSALGTSGDDEAGLRLRPGEIAFMNFVAAMTTVAVLRRAIGLSSRLKVRTLMLSNCSWTEGNN